MLQCLHLTKGRVEVADGFILAVRELDLQEGEESPEALIPSKMIKNVKAGKKQQALLAVEDSQAVVTYQDEEGEPIDFEPSYSFRTYGDGKSYPDIKEPCKPYETKKKVQIAINVGLLKKMLSCLPNDGMLRLGITKPDEPLSWYCSNMDRPIWGMLMPMSTDWQDFKWEGIKSDVQPQTETED